MLIIDIMMIILAILLFFVYIMKTKVQDKYIKMMLFIVILTWFIYAYLDLLRWQLIPFYAMWLMIVFALEYHRKNKWVKISLSAMISLSLLLFLLSLIVLPLKDIPDPSGSYIVGTKTYTIEDESRLELYTEDPNDTRKFNVQLWYPSDTAVDIMIDPWIPYKNTPKGLAKSIGLPSFILNHITKIDSNAYHLIPLSIQKDKYPVVVISHGWGGFMNLHTNLAEELASRGYIVASIEHTYGSVAATFSEETVYQYQEALPSRDEVSNFLDYANQLVYTYAGDVSKTLDYLEDMNALNSGSAFSGRLDLDHIGLLGHSTGGGADVAVALNDDRIDAVIGLDAWVEPIDATEIEKGLSMPSLFLRSESWEEGPNNVNLHELVKISHQSMLFQIDGTTHADFSMAYMFSPFMSTIGYTGSLDTDYLVDMQKAIINDFFDQHLRGLSGTLNPNDWEELKEINIS